MEDVQENRLVRKFFKCKKCKEIGAKLVNPVKFKVNCQKCGSYLAEISEAEYKHIKKKINSKKQEEITENNQKPYTPFENVIKNAPQKYIKNTHKNYKKKQSSNKNDKRNNNFNDKKEKHSHKNHRHQSTYHYSDMNMNNINNNNNNNNINNNNINNNNINNNNHPRTRERSANPTSNSINNFFNDFFGSFGIEPISASNNIQIAIETPIIMAGFGLNNPYRIIVQRQNIADDIFDPIFSTFGAIFNGVFRDNFSSNFRSNFRGNFLNEILSILERNQAEAARNKHPPTSEESLKKLKKFNMSDKYCKKNKDGKYELPNCCICLSEIQKAKKTVLLPCGHMFHWSCCLTWLKKNNTCPMCRFEIK